MNAYSIWCIVQATSSSWLTYLRYSLLLLSLSLSFSLLLSFSLAQWQWIFSSALIRIVIAHNLFIETRAYLPEQTQICFVFFFFEFCQYVSRFFEFRHFTQQVRLMLINILFCNEHCFIDCWLKVLEGRGGGGYSKLSRNRKELNFNSSY